MQHVLTLLNKTLYRYKTRYQLDATSLTVQFGIKIASNCQILMSVYFIIIARHLCCLLFFFFFHCARQIINEQIINRL